MPKDWISPGDAIKNFAAELPDTIKVAILVGCTMVFFEPSLESFFKERNHQKKFNSILDDIRPRHRAAECAKLIGVMELTLEHSEGDEKFYKELAEETGLKEMSEMAMRAPLRDRHFRAARAKFYEMRETVLSARALRLWQLLLEDQDPIWPRADQQNDDDC